MDLLELVPRLWCPLLGADGETGLARVDEFLGAEAEAGRSFQPAAERLFRALALTPPAAVRVVLTGQDPYPTPGVPTGLSFDVGPTAPLPGSLRNIFVIPIKAVSTLRSVHPSIRPNINHILAFFNPCIRRCHLLLCSLAAAVGFAPCRRSGISSVAVVKWARGFRAALSG